jgi:LysR family transcriptional regulator for bpeEF and oprC
MALQAFARVVELGGFTKASDSLQMPKTTVSDLVQSCVASKPRGQIEDSTRDGEVAVDRPRTRASFESCLHIGLERVVMNTV